MIWIIIIALSCLLLFWLKPAKFFILAFPLAVQVLFCYFFKMKSMGLEGFLIIAFFIVLYLIIGGICIIFYRKRSAPVINEPFVAEIIKPKNTFWKYYLWIIVFINLLIFPGTPPLFQMGGAAMALARYNNISYNDDNDNNDFVQTAAKYKFQNVQPKKIFTVNYFMIDRSIQQNHWVKSYRLFQIGNKIKTDNPSIKLSTATGNTITATEIFKDKKIQYYIIKEKNDSLSFKTDSSYFIVEVSQIENVPDYTNKFYSSNPFENLFFNVLSRTKKTMQEELTDKDLLKKETELTRAEDKYLIQYDDTIYGQSFHVSYITGEEAVDIKGTEGQEDFDYYIIYKDNKFISDRLSLKINDDSKDSIVFKDLFEGKEIKYFGKLDSNRLSFYPVQKFGIYEKRFNNQEEFNQHLKKIKSKKYIIK